MKKAILVLVIVAVAAVIGFKLAGRKPEPQPQPAPVASQQSTGGKPIFYLFHDPSDQDAGCRRIYAFADRCETELAGKVEVKRPDVEREKNLVEQYQVRVLPTILIASPTGEVQERFEGEDKITAERIDQSLSRLKERMQ